MIQLRAQLAQTLALNKTTHDAVVAIVRLRILLAINELLALVLTCLRYLLRETQAFEHRVLRSHVSSTYTATLLAQSRHLTVAVRIGC